MPVVAATGVSVGQGYASAHVGGSGRAVDRAASFAPHGETCGVGDATCKSAVALALRHPSLQLEIFVVRQCGGEFFIK